MARRRRAGRPDRPRQCARRRRGRARRRVAAPRLGGNALGGSAPATEATARRERPRGARVVADGGREGRCDRRRSNRLVPAPLSAVPGFHLGDTGRRHAAHEQRRAARPREHLHSGGRHLRLADVARHRLGGCTAPGRTGGGRRPSSARAARTSGGCSRCGGAGRLRPQAVARRPGIRAGRAACGPGRLRADGGVTRRDRALACAGRDPDRVHCPRPPSARRERRSSVRPHRPLRDRPVQRPPDGRGRPPARDRFGAAGRGGGCAAVTARRPLLVVAAGCVAATGLGLLFGEGRTVALASGLGFAAACAGRGDAVAAAPDRARPAGERAIGARRRPVASAAARPDRRRTPRPTRGRHVARATERAGAARRRAVGDRPSRPPVGCVPRRRGSRRQRPAGGDRPAGAAVTEEPTAGVAVQELAIAVADAVEQAIIGKREAVELVLFALLADGHVLIEDLPGLGKTLLARSFAQVCAMDFARIQFTPDLIPSDITGASIYDRSSDSFTFERGPIFTNILLADEINRAPGKTQAALFEAMEERQVTLENTTRQLESPFLVLATQNPIEYEGTYPLPEAQLDRFLVRIAIGYPSEEAEREILHC